jgi:ATP-dependent RNA helicase A
MRYEKLEENLAPEILRTPLHEVALSIKLLRLGDIQTFLSKALEPPPIDAVIEAISGLQELQALDKILELTPLGTFVARLPFNPRLGKMVVLASIFGLGDAAACIVAQSTSSQDVFVLGKSRINSSS